MGRKKPSIAQANKHLNTPAKRREMVVDAVYSSSRIEGSKTTKKQIRAFYDQIKKSSAQ